MTPKQKANIVSWICLGVIWCLLIAAFVSLAHWHMDPTSHALVGTVLVMRFEQWYSRRQKRYERKAEPPSA